MEGQLRQSHGPYIGGNAPAEVLAGPDNLQGQTDSLLLVPHGAAGEGHKEVGAGFPIVLEHNLILPHFHLKVKDGHHDLGVHGGTVDCHLGEGTDFIGNLLDNPGCPKVVRGQPVLFHLLIHHPDLPSHPPGPQGHGVPGCVAVVHTAQVQEQVPLEMLCGPVQGCQQLLFPQQQ